MSPFFLLLQYRPSFTVTVTVAPFFQLLQCRPSFCCYSIALLSTVTVSPFSTVTVTVSPFFLLLQYRPFFCYLCYSIALLSTVIHNPCLHCCNITRLCTIATSLIFALLQHYSSLHCCNITRLCTVAKSLAFSRPVHWGLTGVGRWRWLYTHFTPVRWKYRSFIQTVTVTTS